LEVLWPGDAAGTAVVYLSQILAIKIKNSALSLSVRRQGNAFGSAGR